MIARWIAPLAIAFLFPGCEKPTGEDLLNVGSQASPVSIPFGSGIRGSVAKGGKSYFRFTPTETRSYTLITSNISHRALLEVRVRSGDSLIEDLQGQWDLYESGCNDLIPRSPNALETRNQFECRFRFNKGTDYEITFDNEYTCYTSGQCSVLQGNTFQILIKANSESEGSLEIPVAVPSPGKYSSHIDYYDYDYFKFTAISDTQTIVVSSPSYGVRLEARDKVGPLSFANVPVMPPWTGVEKICYMGSWGPFSPVGGMARVQPNCKLKGLVPGESYFLDIFGSGNDSIRVEIE